MSNKINKARNNEKSAISFKYWKSVNIKDELNCIKCNEIKALKEFYRLSLSNQPFREQSIYKYKSTCRICERIRYKKVKDKKYNTLNGRVAKLLSDIKYRSKKKKLKFNLTHNDIVEKFNSQSGLCFYSKEKMSLKRNSLNVLSIDRVDSKRGYTSENTVLSCWVYNNMKQDLSFIEFKRKVKQIYFHRIKTK